MKRSASRSVLGLFGLVLFASVGLADESPATVDALIDQALYKSISKGFQLYSQGDFAGCYRTYQGSLLTIGPFLSHRPELLASVDKALATAETTGTIQEKAMTLRAVLDDVRSKVTMKSLWTRLGGEPAVKAVVHDFVLKAAGDPKVDFTRGGKYQIDAAGMAHLEETLVQLVSAVSGGPLKYTGKDMKSSHAGMGITEAQFGAIAGDLIEVLKSYNVPQKEINELVGIIATTRKDIVEPPKPVDPTSLWARLGGAPAVKAVVHDFVLKAAGDPKVDFTRGGKYTIDAAGLAHLEKMLVEQVSAISGGPLTYTGKAMKPVHAGMGITNAQFGAIAGDLIAVLKSYKVPQKEIGELIDLIATTKNDIVEAPK